MRCAVVDSQGIVVNIIIADYRVDKLSGGDTLIFAPDTVAIGAKWNTDGSFTNPIKLGSMPVHLPGLDTL